MVDDASCHLSCYTSMHASIYIALLWRYGRLKFFQKSSFRNRGQSSVGPQYYTHLIYSSHATLGM